MRHRALLITVATLSLGRTLCGQAAGAAPPAAGRDVTWARLFPNIASDQKNIWLFPAKLARGRHLLPTLAVVGAAAILIQTDAHTAPYFRGTDTFGRFNSIFTSKSTEVGTFVAPVALYAAGWLAKDQYARHTALLAGEAVADTEILTAVMKDIDRRRRPATYPPNARMSDSWFDSPGSWIRGRGSFPSGHAIAAFSVATVFARRYPHRRWIPYVAYSLAGLVTFSRMTLSAHFPSDAFMGAALGYSISRYVVLRR
jgi:membrane-associated phospholipid phosphatase